MNKRETSMDTIIDKNGVKHDGKMLLRNILTSLYELEKALQCTIHEGPENRETAEKALEKGPIINSKD
jgi:hypothetical protein